MNQSHFWAQLSGQEFMHRKLCSRGGNFPGKRYVYLNENQMGSETIG